MSRPKSSPVLGAPGRENRLPVLLRRKTSVNVAPISTAPKLDKAEAFLGRQSPLIDLIYTTVLDLNLSSIAVRPRGRPRSGEAHAAILRSTAELLGEGGYAALTIEGVATHAGVARRTIYRRWSSKLKLVTELLAGVSGSAPLPDTGSIRSDIVQLYERYIESIPTPGGFIVPALIAESLYNSELAAIVRDYIMTRREQAMHIFDRAVARGEMAPNTRPDLLVDFLSGFTWYRKLIAGIEVRREDASAIADLLLHGMGHR